MLRVYSARQVMDNKRLADSVVEVNCDNIAGLADYVIDMLAESVVNSYLSRVNKELFDSPCDQRYNVNNVDDITSNTVDKEEN